MNRLMRTAVFISCLPSALLMLGALPQPAWADGPAVSPFDGRSLAGWTTVSGEAVTRGWEAVDGVIHLKKEEQRAGNIVTAIDYGDFDLSFDFKIASGGNSGLKYRVRKFGGRTLGCEYQILDDLGLSQEQATKHTTGSLYDVYEPVVPELLMRPDGEFNSARIVVMGGHIQHWLNGQLIVSAFVGSPEWNRRIANSKFADVAGFGRNRFGKLMLTDHGSEVWYKNFRMQPIQTSQFASRRGRAGGWRASCGTLRRGGRWPWRLAARRGSICR